VTVLHLDSPAVAGRSGLRLDLPALTLSPGVVHVVIGPNGSGKSTLLGAALGMVPLARGAVRAGGTSIDALSRSERASTFAWLPQQPTLEGGLTAEEAVASGRYRFAEPWPASLTAARRALEQVGALPLASRRLDRLSGGEAQRVGLASLAAQEAAWWLLDEPGNHLDPAVRLDLVDLVAARAAQGGGVILVTHDLGLLPHLAPARVLGLRDGGLHLDLHTSSPDLAPAVGRLLDLDVEVVQVRGAARWVTLGRRT
jgi:iron complex transport system ATP-binding protein